MAFPRLLGLPPRLRADADDPSSGPSRLLSGFAIAAALLAIVFGLAVVFRRPQEPAAVVVTGTGPRVAQKATLVTAALVPFVTSQRVTEQRAQIHWRNTGPGSIGAVYADVQAFDATGVLTYEGRGQQIFFAQDESQVVPKGKVYAQPIGNSLPIPAQRAGPPTKLKVTITRAEGFAESRQTSASAR